MSIWDKFTPEQIQAARVAVANKYRDHAEHVLNNNYGWADHVTLAEKKQKQIDLLAWANAVESGLKDHNLSVSQSIYYELTGESIAILP